MMVCTVCPHAKRREIDRMIVSGQSARVISRHLGGAPAHDAINRHRDCISAAIEKSGIASALTAKSVITDLVGDLRDMASECRNGVRDDFLRTADRLTRATEVFGKLTGEIQPPNVQAMFVSLGVQSESDLRSALQTTRQAVTVDELFAESLESLRFVLAERPELRAVALAAIGREASSAEVLPGTNGHQTNGNGAGE